MRVSLFTTTVALSIAGLVGLSTRALPAAEKPDFARRVGDFLERSWKERPEWGEMAVAILKGEGLDGEKGWWRSGGKLLGWEWLRTRFDRDANGRIEQDELPAADRYFQRLDIDRDGALTASDFEAAGGRRRRGPSDYLFYRLDADSNGRISREELSEFFQAADHGGLGFLTREDLAVALLDPEESRGGGGDDMPSPWLMLGMLLSGQIGSFREGPRLGELAPDFGLETREGETHRLSDSRGKRPVVLIFGSFT